MDISRTDLPQLREKASQTQNQRGKLSISEHRQQEAKASIVRYYLSDNSDFESNLKTFLKQVATGKIKAGKSKDKSAQVIVSRKETAQQANILIAVIDAGNTIAEANETNNNRSFGPLPVNNSQQLWGFRTDVETTWIPGQAPRRQS